MLLVDTLERCKKKDSGMQKGVDGKLTHWDRRVVTSHAKTRFYVGENKIVSFYWMYIR